MQTGAAMTRILIRVDAELSDEFTSAFPGLTSRPQRHTTLTGQLNDQEELQGVLNHLRSMGVDIVEVVTFPE
jgi:hypothetical protein